MPFVKKTLNTAKVFVVLNVLTDFGFLGKFILTLILAETYFLFEPESSPK